MSIAGALGDRWAIRTQPSWVAAGSAEDLDAASAAGDAAATKTAAPPSKVVIAASRATCLRSFTGNFLSSDPCPPQRKCASDRGRGSGRALWVIGQDRREQPER